MRALAACQFTLSRFGGWCLAVVSFAVCVVLALALWLLDQPMVSQASRAIALLAVAAAALALARSLVALKPVSLRWDGRHWHVGLAPSIGQEPFAGGLAVSLDLGFWMLLRFQPASADCPGRLTWLPVQRRGLESQWHALRCAVYSARPVAEPDAAAEL